MPKDNAQPLEVPWTLIGHPPPAQAWFEWLEPVADSDDAQLENRLGFPARTIAVLRRAFENKLSRRVGWLVSAASPLGAPVHSAGTIFRRGVQLDGVRSSAPHASQGCYSIHFGRPSALRANEFLVIDPQVNHAWPTVTAVHRAVGVRGEENKSLEAVAVLLERWRAEGCPSPWVIVGGGLLSDVAAFAAVLAQVPFRLVPTTLLAMVDACVGGKTGVNFPPYGKNQLGAFAFPTGVTVWSAWLDTLPSRDLLAGGAECLKHALLVSDLPWMERLAHALSCGNNAALASELRRLIEVKAAIVSRDPTENGERAILNLGHTLAHALEGLSHARTRGEATILHGEAVAYGLAFALLLSRRVAGLASDHADRALALLRQSGALRDAPHLRRTLGGSDLREDSLWGHVASYMTQDKKRGADNEFRFVLLGPKGIPLSADDGSFTVPVPPHEVRGTWDELVAWL